jgi:outer membrane biosynthesis protein TonB
MRAQEKQRLILSAVIAGVLHILVLFIRFVVDFPQPDSEEYRGPVTISFAQDIVPEETSPAQESTPQDNANNSQDQEVPDNPVSPENPSPPAEHRRQPQRPQQHRPKRQPEQQPPRPAGGQP